MQSCRKFVSVILASYFVLVTCSTSMAEELSSNSVIIGSSTETSKIVELLKLYNSISVSPLLVGGPVDSSQPPIMLDSNTASNFLAMTQAAAVWDYGSATGPSLRLMPFDVNEVTQAHDWERVSGNLSADPNNTLVILGGPNNPKIVKNLTTNNIKTYWDNFFSNYSTVRALGLSDVVYIEPVATNAKQQRQDVFQRHAGDIHSLIKSLQTVSMPEDMATNNMPEDMATNNMPEVFDEVFKELSAAYANSNQIAQFHSVWETDIRDLGMQTNLDTSSADRVKQFAENFSLLLNDPKPYQCVATISTSNGPGAEIKIFKSLLDPNTATYIGVSKVTGLIECAQWTFISYRKKEGNPIEDWSIGGRDLRQCAHYNCRH